MTTKENAGRIPKPEKKEFKHPHCVWGSCQECWGIEQYNKAIDEYEKYHDQEIKRLQSAVLSLEDMKEIVERVKSDNVPCYWNEEIIKDIYKAQMQKMRGGGGER